jgi:hypothetical protein
MIYKKIIYYLSLEYNGHGISGRAKPDPLDAPLLADT